MNIQNAPIYNTSMQQVNSHNKNRNNNKAISFAATKTAEVNDDKKNKKPFNILECCLTMLILLSTTQLVLTKKDISKLKADLGKSLKNI